MLSAFRSTLIAKRDELKKDEGFTLIELLVVILIIGVLAAIAVPVFIGQVGQSQDSAAKANLMTAKTAYISYLVDHSGGLAEGEVAGAQADLNDLGWPNGDPAVSFAAYGDADSFCLTAESDSGAHFSVDGTGGAVYENNSCTAAAGDDD